MGIIEEFFVLVGSNGGETITRGCKAYVKNDGD